MRTVAVGSRAEGAARRTSLAASAASPWLSPHGRGHRGEHDGLPETLAHLAALAEGEERGAQVEPEIDGLREPALRQMPRRRQRALE